MISVFLFGHLLLHPCSKTALQLLIHPFFFLLEATPEVKHSNVCVCVCVSGGVQNKKTVATEPHLNSLP